MSFYNTSYNLYTQIPAQKNCAIAFTPEILSGTTEVYPAQPKDYLEQYCAVS